MDSGVGTKTYNNGTLLNTVTKNTALGYYYSGSWSHCWLEGGPNTGTLVNNALTTWVPDYNLCLILLNNPGFGVCGGGGFAVLPLGITWDTIAHEFGHGLGGFCNEYCETDKTYTGGEPGCVDNTINTNRATLKWTRFVNPATPVPTGVGKCANYTQGVRPADWDDNQSVGLFEGARRQGGPFRLQWRRLVDRLSGDVEIGRFLAQHDSALRWQRSGMANAKPRSPLCRRSKRRW